MRTPPGSGDEADQLKRLQRQVEELSRRKPLYPVCQVAYGPESTQVGSGEKFAGTGWNIVDDPDGMLTSAAQSFITVPIPGRYMLRVQITYTGVPSDGMGPRAYLNGTTSDHRILIGYQGNVGGTVRATKSREVNGLSAGDQIYWSHVSDSGPANLIGGPANSEILVRYIGPR